MSVYGPEVHVPYGMNDPLYGEVDGTEEDHVASSEEAYNEALLAQDMLRDCLEEFQGAFHQSTGLLWDVDDVALDWRFEPRWFSVFYIWVQEDKFSRYIKYLDTLRKDN